ncbi:MAG: NUDIX hydrolase [Gemmatimonadetes bacterium]|nr:NUDIX hydrolase [Gemmatimonadota bacterium]MBT8405402.1 NUDIX hydrolase [Gemmatimonadota bacterium]NNF37820.1 NUDIX hydrolase [Gemmatimonadota bacterium]
MSHPRIERSAGGVVLRRIDGEQHVLIIRDPYDNWGLPKGHLERGEDERAAARREVHEETGLAVNEVGAELGCIDWYFRVDGHSVHKFCTFFLMRAPRGDATPEVAEGITECVWLPLDQAIRRLTYDNARAMLQRAADVLQEDS